MITFEEIRDIIEGEVYIGSGTVLGVGNAARAVLARIEAAEITSRPPEKVSMYKIILKKDEFATVKKNGKEIECLSGLFVTTGDLAQLDELIRLANRGAAKQNMHWTGGGCPACEDDRLDGEPCPICESGLHPASQ